MAVVADLDPNVPSAVNGNAHARPLAAVAEGVVEQVVEDPAHLFGIADGEHRLCREAVVQASVEQARPGLDPLDGGEGSLAQIEHAVLEWHGAGLEPGGYQEL